MKAIIFLAFVCLNFSLFSQDQFLVINPDGHKSTIRDIVIDNKNNIITCGLDKSIKVWDSKRGNIIKEFRGQIGPGSEGMIYAIDLSPDQKYLAVGGWFGNDDESERLGDVRIYNYQTGKLEIVLTRIHENVIFDLKFTKDSKYIIIGDGDGIITKWDIRTKNPFVYEMVGNEAIRSISVTDDYFISTHGDGMIYKWDLEKTKHKKSIDFFNKPDKLFNVETIATISEDGESIAVAGKELSMVLIFNKNLKLQSNFNITNSKHITDLSFSPSSKKIIVSYFLKSSGNRAEVFELMGKSWEKIVHINNAALLGNVRFLNENTCVCAGGFNNEISVWSIKNDKVKILKSMSGIGQVYFSASLNGSKLMYGLKADDAYGLASYSDVFNLFSRRKEPIQEDVKTNYPQQKLNGWSLQEIDVIRKTNYDPSYILEIKHNDELKAKIKRYPYDGNRHRTFSFVNSKYLVSGGDYGILRAYDYTGKEVSQFVGHQDAVSSVSISVDGRFLVSAGYDNTFKLWPLNQIGQSQESAKISSIWKVIDDQGIYSWKAKIKKVGGEESAKKETTNAWKEVISKLEEKGYEPEFFISYLNSTLANRIFPIVSIFVASNSEWVIWNSDGYFSGSKKGAQFIGYHINQGKFKAAKFYPFEQFDLQYNRPDIIFRDLGITDKSILDLYYKAYQKRLKRAGIKESDFNSDLHIPNIKINSKNKHDNKVDISIKAWDTKYALKRLHIYINDVPVFGVKGKNIGDLNSKEFVKSYSLDLMEGENKVQVSVINKKGAESYKETVYINNNYELNKDLYVVSMGVSNYKDSRFNLKYAAKDAEDVVNQFDDNKLYSTVHNLLLTNERVTKDNIFRIKDFLVNVKANDVVILFVAGHGVLNNDYDYYFCTYDVDFNNPEKNGISYLDLENLFDGIKAIRKLLIMDTCHSGEIDKDEVEEVIEENTEEGGDIIFRSTSTTVLRERKGLKATNEIVKEMFNDLNKGTGTTVISSAGGVEFAMESDLWKNGLFTYCLLNGLQSKKADLNGDGVIYLSELQYYIREEVRIQSNGKQVPTSRFENISLDYPIW